MNTEQNSEKRFEEWYEQIKFVIHPPIRPTPPYHGKPYYYALSAWHEQERYYKARLSELEKTLDDHLVECSANRGITTIHIMKLEARLSEAERVMDGLYKKANGWRPDVETQYPKELENYNAYKQSIEDKSK